MKALGIFFIALCLAINTSIGGFLFYKGFIQKEPVNPNISTAPITGTFAEYGFNIELPAGYEKVPVEPGSTLLTVYVHRNGATTNPTLQIYVGEDQRLMKTMSATQYKEYSAARFQNNSDIQYIDGGLSSSSQNLPLYYDLILEKSGVDTYKEKTYTLYHKGNEIIFLWADDPNLFDGTLPNFEAIMNTVTTY